MPRQATGLRRPIQVPCFFSDEEYKELKKYSKKTKLSMTEILRTCFFIFIDGDGRRKSLPLTRRP